MVEIRLGLIGDNITRSKAPLLHRLAGEFRGLDVRYDRLIPKDMGMDFDAVFDGCARDGYRGVNVTYPCKERAAAQGLTIVSGYELFFHQGVDARDIFVGLPLDHDALRQALADETVNERAG